MTSPQTLIAEPLWQRTRNSFARAIEAIGTPAIIAALKMLTRELRRAIVGRIFRLEHTVRKLLLAEAGELHRAELARAKRRVKIEYIPLRGMAQHWRPGSGTASLQASTAPAVAEKCEPGSRSKLDRSNPETWFARFSFALPRDPHVVPESRAPRIRALGGPTPPPPPPPPERAPRVIRAEDSPFRLARRLEALRRVLADPMPHAERLARLLARAVRRFPEIVRRYWFAPSRTNDYDKADERLAIDAYGACYEASFAFSDSS